eukprot:6472088-Amphidinium_carterae.4
MTLLSLVFHKAANRTHAKSLHGVDSFWCLDESLIAIFTSSETGTLLKTSWEQKLAAASTVAGAVVASTALQASNGYKWAPPAVRGEVYTAHQFLSRLAASEPVVEAIEYTD